ncbi:MAG: hypothetical protein RLZZ164_382 [Actinomycetota bacterium]
MDLDLRLAKLRRVSALLGGWLIPAGFIGLLFYFPLGSILLLGFSGEFLGVLGTPIAVAAIWFTLWQAVVSVALALAIGLPLSYLLYRRRFFGSAFLRNLMLVPFVTPTIVVVIALQPLRVLPTWMAILAANLFLNLAVIVRGVGSSWQSLDRNLDDAARLDGANGWRLIRSIHVPVLRSAILSSASLVFLYCATSFAIVLSFGGGQIQSIETLTYYSLTAHLDLPTASVLALVQTVITVVVFLLSRRGDVAVEDLSLSAAPLASRFSVFAVWGFIAVAFALPIGQVLARGLNAQAFDWLNSLGARGLLDITVWQALANSLRNSLIAASLALVVGTLVAKLSTRRPGLRLWFVLPLGVSSVMLGFGYLVAFGGEPLPLRSSWMVVPLVQSVLATPLVVRGLSAALDGLPRELAESAATAGASGWQIWRMIELPLIAIAFKNAVALALLVSIGEFGSAALLSYGKQATLPVVLFRLISRPGEQNYSMAMAAASLMIIFVFAVVTLTSAGKPKN